MDAEAWGGWGGKGAGVCMAKLGWIRQGDQGLKFILSHIELEASLGYTRPCHERKRQTDRERRKEGGGGEGKEKTKRKAGEMAQWGQPC